MIVLSHKLKEKNCSLVKARPAKFLTIFLWISNDLKGINDMTISIFAASPSPENLVYGCNSFIIWPTSRISPSKVIFLLATNRGG